MISCNDYDYIEIVCMYSYPIKLTMKSTEIIRGVALDTQRNELREECIKISAEDESNMLVVLDNIKKLEICVENPHFNEITFE